MNLKNILGLAACLLFSGSLHAALVSSLQFKDPIGTVGATDTIDIWVTFSLAEESDPLVIDNSLGYPFGLPEALMPATGVSSAGIVPFASYAYVNRAMGISCTYFMTLCVPGASYELSFNRGDDSFVANQGERFVMSPGESRDFLFGSLIPVGDVALGDYVLFDVSFRFHPFGLDEAGNVTSASVPIASTCAGRSCSFTRTVVSDVPIPAAALLFASGIGLLGGAARRQRGRAAGR